MASDNETVADIVAEKRRMADEIEASAGGKSNQFQRELIADLRGEADRIESAHKREVGVAKSATTTGNAAKMREALSNACYAMFDSLKTQNGGFEEMAKALDKAKAALAAPPRNCDVGTVEEQKERLDAYCDEHQCVYCPLASQYENKSGVCTLGWAQMPYEEGGAK